MKYCIHLLVITIVTLLPISVRATQLHTTASAVELGHSPGWRRHLYLSNERQGPAKPKILEPTFYFTEGPAIDPVEEMAATITAMVKTDKPLGDEHPICRFPSRFLYLQRHLNLRPEVDILSDCPAFSDWAGLTNTSQVTVVMVDGYYGNPASSFGHLIVRVGQGDASRALLDNSINYGANVPEDDGTLVYILKGLFGGYQAGFTRDDFYRQDLVYTRTEYRDMWNYRLNLSPEQRLKFVALVWELTGHPGVYYFVKSNCAFAIAEALEIVLEREVVDQDVNWYAPVTLFQQLEDMDATSPSPLIAEREFMPSQKRQLANILNQLNADQADAVRTYLNRDDIELESLLAPFDERAAAAVLEALIEYYDYLIQGYPEIGTDLYEHRRDLLVARLARPAGQALVVEPVRPGTPAGQTARTARLTLGARLRQDQTDTLLGFTPYQRSATDRGNDDLSELTALNIRLAITDEDIELDDFTAIQVSQRSDLRQRLPDQWPISWDVDLGADCLVDCASQEGIRLGVGLGQTLGAGPFRFSALGRLLVNGNQPAAQVEGEVGLPEQGGWALQSRVGYRLPLVEGDPEGLIADARLRFSPSIRHSLLLDSQLSQDDWRHRLSWQWHYR